MNYFEMKKMYKNFFEYQKHIHIFRTLIQTSLI